jgi:phosphatidylinositol glycan class Q protein
MGLTMTLALLSDMVSFFTIHVFYFYTVSARFYAIMLHILSSLWKLFRGTAFARVVCVVCRVSYQLRH